MGDRTSPKLERYDRRTGTGHHDKSKTNEPPVQRPPKTKRSTSDDDNSSREGNEKLKKSFRGKDATIALEHHGCCWRWLPSAGLSFVFLRAGPSHTTTRSMTKIKKETTNNPPR